MSAVSMSKHQIFLYHITKSLPSSVNGPQSLPTQTHLEPHTNSLTRAFHLNEVLRIFWIRSPNGHLVKADLLFLSDPGSKIQLMLACGSPNFQSQQAAVKALTRSALPIKGERLVRHEVNTVTNPSAIRIPKTRIDKGFQRENLLS